MIEKQTGCIYANEKTDFDNGELRKILFKPSQHRLAHKDEVTQKLAELQPVMPHAIAYKHTKNNRKKLFLDIKYLDEFVAHTDFITPAPKGEDDFNTTELYRKYRGQKKNYLPKLETMKKTFLQTNDERNKYIEYKKNHKSGKIELCLNAKLLPEFEKMFNPRHKSCIKKRPKNFISSQTLAEKYIASSVKIINDKLRDIHENQDDELNKFTFANNKMMYLDRSHIDVFCERFGYTQKRLATDYYGPRPSSFCSHQYWKTGEELKNFVMYDEDNLPFDEMLDEFRVLHPSAIRSNQTWDSYSMNLNFLDLFCKTFSLQKNPVPMKNDEWKNAKELSVEYIESSQTEILSKMNDLFLSMPDLLQVRKNYDTNQDDICLNIKHITDFCREAKLEMFNEAKIKYNIDWL